MKDKILKLISLIENLEITVYSDDPSEDDPGNCVSCCAMSGQEHSSDCAFFELKNLASEIKSELKSQSIVDRKFISGM